MVFLSHLHHAGRGVKTLLAELSEVLAKEMSCSLKASHPAHAQLLLCSASPREGAPGHHQRSEPSLHCWPQAFGSNDSLGSSASGSDVIPGQESNLVTPAAFPVLGVRILRSVGSTHLLGQTCSRDVEADKLCGQQGRWPRSSLGLPRPGCTGWLSQWICHGCESCSIFQLVP